MVTPRSASTVVLLSNRPDLHVLTIRRSEKLAFAPGYTAFPGGAVEESDRDNRWGKMISGLTSEEADKKLEVSENGLSFFIAAARETIEEVGILVGTKNQKLLKHRQELERNETFLIDLLSGSEGLDFSDIHPISRWITPEPSPRRYDTYFFIAPVDPETNPEVDGFEAIESNWGRPSEILENWRNGLLTMISPTRSVLQRLETYSSVEDVITAAKMSNIRHRVRIGDEWSERVYFHGEQDYDNPVLVDSLGWMWLPASDESLKK